MADDEDKNLDNDRDKNTTPGIPRPGEQPDQMQIPGAPPQPQRQEIRQSQGRPSNPDLDPFYSQHQQRGLDLRDPDPLTPRGMLFDPRQLLEGQNRPSTGFPPHGIHPPPQGARFDPFGPPDPGSVGPGRGPQPFGQFGGPDPDHLPPPGVNPPGTGPRPRLNPDQPPFGKSLKFPPGGPLPPRGGGPGPFL